MCCRQVEGRQGAGETEAGWAAGDETIGREIKEDLVNIDRMQLACGDHPV